jgi:hypothetical protein
MRLAGHVASIWKINAFKIVIGKHGRRRPPKRPRRRWEDYISTDLREIEWKGVDWMHLVEDRDQWRTVVNTVMYLRVPQKVGNFLTSCVTFSFSRSMYALQCSSTRNTHIMRAMWNLPKVFSALVNILGVAYWLRDSHVAIRHKTLRIFLLIAYFLWILRDIFRC